MTRPCGRKQVSLWFPLADWQAMQRVAAEHHLPLTELCRQWLEPHLQALRQNSPETALMWEAVDSAGRSTDTR